MLRFGCLNDRLCRKIYLQMLKLERIRIESLRREREGGEVDEDEE